MKNVWTLTKFRIRLAVRNRAFLFFSLIMPLAFLFLYSSVFAKGDPRTVAYMMPAVLALTVMGSFWGLSIQLVMFREHGILRRFRLTPVGASDMLLSSILSNYFLMLPTVVVELLLAVWVYHVPSLGNLWGVFVVLSLGTVAFASFGLIVASVTNTIQETQVINNAIWFVFLFLSGATIPLVFLPGWVQHVGLFLPATHLVTGLQMVFVVSWPLLRVGPEVVALAGGAVMAYVVALKLFRWEAEEKVGRREKAWAAAVVIPFLLLGLWANTQGNRLGAVEAIFKSISKSAEPVVVPEPATPAAQTPPH